MTSKMSDEATPMPTDIDLEVIRTAAENAGGHPWKVESGEFSGHDWLVASFGRDGSDDRDYFVVTDRVHASEHCGTAKTEAEHVATADPYTVLRLVQLVEELRAEKETLMWDHHAGQDLINAARIGRELIVENTALRTQLTQAQSERETYKQDALRMFRELAEQQEELTQAQADCERLRELCREQVEEEFYE